MKYYLCPIRILTCVTFINDKSWNIFYMITEQTTTTKPGTKEWGQTGFSYSEQKDLSETQTFMDGSAYSQHNLFQHFLWICWQRISHTIMLNCWNAELRAGQIEGVHLNAEYVAPQQKY